ncbi:MAG: hypothetical protein HOM58_22690 [Rhodospirillaceae bacterium]|jgi:hypothetical protein|nr:hypothetical protein [Rhodospirillaceae bacterium]MBT5457745.1 hypothetical protein [Rhodospirillaceae bacterium]
MKRQIRAVKPKKKQQAGSPAKAKAPGKMTSRREFFAKLSNVALITAAGGGVGWFFIDEVCATTRENDLTRIGNGIPAVVQIHDPECPRCRALQREARDAMSNFKENELQYLVANVRLAKGRQLATRHGVGHVTLLLFDGKGNRRGILAGPNTSDYLESVFRNHLVRVPRK